MCGTFFSSVDRNNFVCNPILDAKTFVYDKKHWWVLSFEDFVWMKNKRRINRHKQKRKTQNVPNSTSYATNVFTIRRDSFNPIQDVSDIKIVHHTFIIAFALHKTIKRGFYVYSIYLHKCIHRMGWKQRKKKSNIVNIAIIRVPNSIYSPLLAILLRVMKKDERK